MGQLLPPTKRASAVQRLNAWRPGVVRVPRDDVALYKIGIAPAALHPRHRAAIAIRRSLPDRGLGLEAQRREVLSTHVPEGLFALGRVDFGKAHAHLLVWVCRVLRRAAGGEGEA